MCKKGSIHFDVKGIKIHSCIKNRKNITTTVINNNNNAENDDDDDEVSKFSSITN